MMMEMDRIATSEQTTAPYLARLAASPRRQARLLAVLAAVLLAACAFYAFYLPQTPGRMARTSSRLIPHLELWDAVADLRVPGTDSPETVAALLLAVGLLAFGAYAAAIAVSWWHGDRRSTLAVAGAGAVLLAAVSVVAMPTINTDVYNYIVSARVASEYDENPHYVAPARFPRDPIYPYASTQYTTIPGDNKLPAWTLFNVTIAEMAGDRVVDALLFYRGSLLVVHLASVALIVWIVRRLAPGHQATGLVVFAWNPIVTVYATSKSDTLMVFFLLLAVAWLVYGHERWAVVPLTLSVLVKLLTLPLGAIYALRVLRQGSWRDLAIQAALAAGVVALLYAPFIRGPELIAEHLELLDEGGSGLPRSLKPLAAAGALALVILLGWFWSDTVPRLLQSWMLILLYFALFLTRFAFAWYLLVLIALAAVMFNWRLHVLVVALTCSAFLVTMWSSTSNRLFPLPDLISARVVAYYLLPLAALVVLALTLAWRRRLLGNSGTA